MEKDIKNESTKPYELLAVLFGTTPEEICEKLNDSEELTKDLTEALSILSSREYNVLKLRYGLENESKKTIDEVGELLDFSRDRVRQIEIKAIMKIKKFIRNKNAEKSEQTAENK